MIELKNVSKIYKPSKGVSVKALSNINLLFKEKGFVVLTGESGSGKTTLLNILAGLDNYTQGDMLIDGISTKRIKEKEWDEYRNKRVGIVFQNYSLLEEFSVKKNVSLALELQRIDDKKEWVEWALDEVNMYDYTNKRVNKLSGGQKQRVAIARAIVKDPQIILADEPTGNLDTTNSEEIFELLKELSKEHLVVVITHNIELANKYADRIIRLVDGKIVEDNKLTKEILEEPTKEKSLPPKGLKLSSILKLGLSSMTKQWFRLLATIMMLIVMLTSIGIALGVSRYSKNEVLARVVLEGDNTLLAIKKNSLEAPTFTEKDEQYFKEKGYKAIEVIDNDENLVFKKYYLLNGELEPAGDEIAMKQYYSRQPSGFVAIEDLKDSGLTFELINGRWPENNFEVCITKYTASVLLADETIVNYNNQHGDTRNLLQEEIIGLNVMLNEWLTINIVGIVDTKLSDKYFDAKKENYDELYEELKGIHNVLFVKKAFLNNILTYNPILRVSYPSYMIMQGGFMYKMIGRTQVYTESIANKLESYDTEFVLGDHILDDGEILVPKDFFIALMNERSGSIEYTNETDNIDDIIRNRIQDGFSFDSTISSFYNRDTEDLCSTHYTVVGLTDCPQPIISDSYSSLADTSLEVKSTTYLVNPKEINVEELIDLADNYSITTSRIYDINSVSNRANQIKVLGILLGILFGLLSIITIIDFTQSSIKGSYRHIGVLRALGSNKTDIYKIYIIQTIVLATISILLALLALNPIIQYLDQSSKAQEILGITLFETRTIDYVAMCITGILITFTSAILVMYKSLKKNIIDLIYQR